MFPAKHEHLFASAISSLGCGTRRSPPGPSERRAGTRSGREVIGPDADAPRDGNRGEDVLNPFRGERPRLCRRSRGTSSAYPGLFPSLGAFDPFTSPPGEREVKLPQHIDATRRESEAPGKTFVVSANIFFRGISVSRRVFEGHLASGRATRDRRGQERGARWK